MSNANSAWLLRVSIVLVCLLAPMPVAWAQRARGVDVSYWQGNMDWSKTYAAGARFAFVRSSRGLTYDDTLFTQNMTTITNMAAAGKTIYAGAYHYGIPSDALTSSSTARRYHGQCAGRSRSLRQYGWRLYNGRLDAPRFGFREWWDGSGYR